MEIAGFTKKIIRNPASYLSLNWETYDDYQHQFKGSQAFIVIDLV